MIRRTWYLARGCAALMLTIAVVHPAGAQEAPAVGLVKTVGTNATTCATTSSIQVSPGTTVYYCYTISNDGDVDLTAYDLEDSELGVLIVGFAFVLGPGTSFSSVDAGLTTSAVIEMTTTNTATVTADVAGGGTVQGTAQATVEVDPVPVPGLSPLGLAALLLLITGVAARQLRAGDRPRGARASPFARIHRRAARAAVRPSVASRGTPCPDCHSPLG